MPLPYYSHVGGIKSWAFEPLYSKHKLRRKKIRKIFDVDKHNRQKEKSEG